VFGKHTLRLKSNCAVGNCSVRVEITLVLVEITLERFEIKLVRVVIADLFFCFLGSFSQFIIPKTINTTPIFNMALIRR
jgi:hypothetical protein